MILTSIWIGCMSLCWLCGVFVGFIIRDEVNRKYKANSQPVKGDTPNGKKENQRTGRHSAS